MEVNMVEVMLENEEKNSVDRIVSLEKRIQNQSDEIVCLKSALADVIRRLQQVETTQAQQQQQIFHQANSTHTNGSSLSLSGSGKPPVNKSVGVLKKNIKEIHSSLENGKNSDKSHANGVNGTENGHRGSISVSKSEKSSTNGSANQSMLGDKSSKSKQQNDHKALQVSIDYHDKGISFNSDTGSVKFFIRGRPISLYVPNTSQVSPDSNEIGFKFDTESKVKVPKDQLKLEWVYGYRGKDCRSNLYQLPTGEIIYFIAATVVLYNVEERTQRHYLGHTDDVKSLAVHPDKVTIATGQAAGHDKQEGKAHVRIWDSVNLTTLKVIGLNGNEFSNSICCLSFSKADGGQSLAVVDDGNEKWLSVWNWQSGSKQASAKCYGDLVFAAEFHPTEKNQIVTCGKQHIFFWQLEGQHLTKKSGSFEISQNVVMTNGSGSQVPGTPGPLRIDKPKYILCLSFGLNSEVISGDSEGNIIFWNPKDCKITRILKEAHENGIFSILVAQNQANSGENGSSSSSAYMITGGGKDGKLVEWNHEYQKTGRQLQLPESHGMCRFISSGKGSNLFLVGTTKNCIYQVNFEMNYLNCIVNSHVEELWGLSANPRDSNFITSGNDKNLSYWDSLSHSLLWSVQLEDQLHSVHIHPQYDLAAIGLSKAKWLVFDLNERKVVYSQIEGNEQIECIQYSPNGAYLACGSRDNSIYIYAVSENGLKYSRVGRCIGHSSFITHIDWSSDSEYLMSNSGDYEVLYWQASACKQITQVQQIRELNFKTNTCTLSFNTLGIWNSSDSSSSQNGHGSSLDGTDINACAASNSGNLLASVDDFGKVNLYAYPCNGAKAEKRVYSGHSSHVTNVTFINNETRLVSTGGNDMAVFQWAVVSE